MRRIPRLTRFQKFLVAARGIFVAAREQPHFRFHLFMFAVVNILAAMLYLPKLECLILLLGMGLVLSAELLNTAIEAVVDLVSPEYHELAEKAKDIAAGAVLLSAVLAAIAGTAILAPPIVDLIRGWF
ncbi:MAG TPA: diacylglycerol kinase family protein [Planctomicrobium sp.]|nr:diacylglycerol kinase family protein [Planctomicrobium sp.]